MAVLPIPKLPKAESCYCTSRQSFTITIISPNSPYPCPSSQICHVQFIRLHPTSCKSEINHQPTQIIPINQTDHLQIPTARGQAITFINYPSPPAKKNEKLMRPKEIQRCRSKLKRREITKKKKRGRTEDANKS